MLEFKGVGAVAAMLSPGVCPDCGVRVASSLDLRINKGFLKL